MNASKRRIAAVVCFCGLLVQAGPANNLQLKYVVIVSRHGVRSPTWDPERLNQYSAEPWPDWGVPPGNLTPHGRTLITQLGSYYREWLASEHLLRPGGCQDAPHIYIHADSDERTIETGHAFAESILPGCQIPVNGKAPGERDELFSGVGSADAERALQAVRDRVGSDPQKLLADHQAALEALQFVLGRPTVPPSPIRVAIKGKSVEITGPFATGSTLSEDFLLEYANGLHGAALGWGRLTKANLFRIMELHAVHADLMRRTPYLARARGSNLLAHVMWSLQQAVSGQPVPGALGQPGDILLVLSGHDTNLSNLSGMLGLSWTLPDYQPDDAPPGSALIFSLWQSAATGQYSVKLRYLAQTLDQMRDLTPLSLAAPPASQDLDLCGTDATGPKQGCPWNKASSVLLKAISPEFTLPERTGLKKL